MLRLGNQPNRRKICPSKPNARLMRHARSLCNINIQQNTASNIAEKSYFVVKFSDFSSILISLQKIRMCQKFARFGLTVLFTKSRRSWIV
jgi:hypothetical protein